MEWEEEVGRGLGERKRGEEVQKGGKGTSREREGGKKREEAEGEE